LANDQLAFQDLCAARLDSDLGHDRRRAHEDLRAAAQLHRLLLVDDVVVVGHGAPVLELLARQDVRLLVRRNALLASGPARIFAFTFSTASFLTIVSFTASKAC
jgi:hypothetical protein